MFRNYDKAAIAVTLLLALLLQILPAVYLLPVTILLLLHSLIHSWRRDFFLTVFLLHLSAILLDLEPYIMGSSIFLSVCLTFFSEKFRNVTAEVLFFTFLLFLSLTVLIILSGRHPNISYIIFLSVIAGMVSALLDLIARRNKDAVVLLGCSMSMWLFVSFARPIELKYLFVAFLLSLTVGYLSYRFGATDEAGMVSGALIGVLIIIFSDLRWFLMILLFFLSGGISTKYKYELKKKRGMAEDRSGRRSYNNVFGNGLVPLCSSILYGVTGNDVFRVLFLSSLSTVTADTLGSEIGGTSSTEPRMITTLKRAPHGTNGAVTPLGEFATFFGAFLISSASFLLGTSGESEILLILLSGFLGAHVDSILGATLENRGIIGNSGVNLLSSLAGGVFGALLYLSPT